MVCILAFIFSPAHSHAGVSPQKKLNSYYDSLYKEYPLKKWQQKGKSISKGIYKAHTTFYKNPSDGISEINYKKLIKLGKSADECKVYYDNIHKLYLALKTESIISAVFPRSQPADNAREARAISDIRINLKKTEKERLEKPAMLGRKFRDVINKYEELQADWMFYYARNALFKNAKKQFEIYHFKQNADAYREFNKRGKLYAAGVQEEPAKALIALNALNKKMSMPLKHLFELKDQLSPEMLYNGILESAADDKIDFTMKAEAKIEAILQPLSQQNLKIVKDRYAQWQVLRNNINQAITNANTCLQRIDRRNRNKNDVKNMLTNLTNNDSKLSIDGSLDKAMDHKSAAMHKSRIGSARNKLAVKVEGFSDTLAHVNMADVKFENKFNDKFERITADSKENEGIYVHVAKGSRADKSDLMQFVREVGLISFGNNKEFLSYKLPKNWVAGKAIKWQKDVWVQAEASHDREFSYVELFVEAHKVRQQKSAGDYVKKVYIPANMIIIFGSGGEIKRYITFSDIRRLVLTNNDLSGENIYYKFLNYSTRGQYIYLNGIDYQIKMASAL